jgi:hypothetical protein
MKLYVHEFGFRMPWRCVPVRTVPVRFVPWTMRPLDDVSFGRCVPWTMVPWTMRPLYNASLGRCVPWTMRPLDNTSVRSKKNIYFHVFRHWQIYNSLPIRYWIGSSPSNIFTRGLWMNLAKPSCSLYHYVAFSLLAGLDGTFSGVLPRE